jgi:non-specific serine/threonine protein kinase
MAPSQAAQMQAQGPALPQGPIVVLPPQAGDAAGPAPRQRPRAERRDNDRDDTPPRQAARDPSDRCADRNFLLRPMCMKHECDSDPRLRNHPECVRMQQAEQERRDVLNR